MRPNILAVWVSGGIAVCALVWIAASWSAFRQLTGLDPEFFNGLLLVDATIFLAALSAGVFLTFRYALGHQLEYTSVRDDLLNDERREIGRVVARTLVHDVRNVMSILRSNIDYLRMMHEQQESQAALDDLEEALHDLNGLVEHLRENSETTAELDRIDLIESLDLCTRVVRADRRFIDVDVDAHLGGPLAVLGHAVLLRQAILNLFVNAAEAGARTIHLSLETDDDDATITIWDDGPGMEDDVMKRAFEPFFSTKNRGSGLGLVSVAQTIDFHGGAIALDHAPAGGLLVTITLPLPPALATTGADI